MYFGIQNAPKTLNIFIYNIKKLVKIITHNNL